VRAARRRHPIPHTAASLVAAGIIANLTDRVIYGSVRDFLSIPGHAVINLADIAIFAGLVACTLAMLRPQTRPQHQPRR
jgi:lipoprotein signal peptidase